MIKKCGNCSEFCELGEAEDWGYCQSNGREVHKDNKCVWGEKY